MIITIDVAVPFVLREELQRLWIQPAEEHRRVPRKTDDETADQADGRILYEVAQSQHDKRDQWINDQNVDLFQSFLMNTEEHRIAAKVLLHRRTESWPDHLL